ncbi:porin family protein [uncultured Bacteroides sp.]|jgi:hypothetical protein|uniref:porin family protein n=1 Tax=uncultured Bacteroides sp. TaxID=162156 RepID=UPI00280B6DDB|nr:porin family protein [uncultured Bacteroides sp.]
MKKVIFTAILAIGSVFTFTVNAQTTTSFGVKLSGNLTNVKVSDLQNGSNSFKPGVSVGGFAKIEFGEHFALQPELLLSYMDTKTDTTDGKIRFKYASVEIPVYAMEQLNWGKGKVFIGVGPNVGYGFSADTKTEGLPDWDTNANKLELSHWYMGGGAMVGYEFRMGLSISAGYKLTYDLSSKNKASGTDTQTISLGVGYRF